MNYPSDIESVILFSQDHWDAKLKYPRHYMADFFAEKGVKVAFFSKAYLRKIHLKDFLFFFKKKSGISREKHENISES